MGKNKKYSNEFKQEVLAMAAGEDWSLVVQHDPEVVAVKVERTDKGFKVREKLYQL